jgi:hypothetical protein
LRWTKTKYAGSDQSRCDAGSLNSAALTTYSEAAGQLLTRRVPSLKLFDTLSFQSRHCCCIFR